MAISMVVDDGVFIFSTNCKLDRDKFVMTVGAENIISEKEFLDTRQISRHWTIKVHEGAFSRETYGVRKGFRKAA